MDTSVLERLYNKLAGELREVTEKPLSTSTLDSADKLTHAMKNICKLIDYENEDNDYAERMYRYDGGMMGARGRGSSAKRDSRGRYASDGHYMRRSEYPGDGDMMDRLYEMLDNAKDETERKEIQRMIDRMEK